MISNFDDHFNKLLKNFNTNKRFVLGLSGGIDSMSLLHLIRDFIDNKKNPSINCTPIIIDHNLRNESKKEAEEVKKISQSLGFNTQIEKISSPIPISNIQNWARKQRRSILHQKCLKLSANLILGHHFDDQTETLFMRMIKNSALDGLSGMSDISLWNCIYILRPLLLYDKKNIQNYAKNKKIKYFEDSSNTNYKFERVITRLYLNNIKKKIWPNISNDLNFFGRLNSNLIKKTDYVFENWAKNNIIVHKSGAVRVDYESLKIIFKKSQLFAVRLVGKIIQSVGGKEYPPKRKKTFNLIYSLFVNKFKKKSLGNVNVLSCNDYLFFIRENRNISFDVSIEKNEYYIFDGRFLLKSSLPGKLCRCKNSDLMVIDDKNPFNEYRYWINNTIPYLKTLEGETIKPYLSKISQNSKSNIAENKNFKIYLLNRILL